MSQAFHGYPIALRPEAKDGQLGVWFCDQRVAALDLRQGQVELCPLGWGTAG